MNQNNFGDDSKINLVLDLDNTIISSVELKDLDRMKYKHEKLPYKEMEDYRVYARPYLREFLDYAFKNFKVTIWTAADIEYATFIIDKFVLRTHHKNSDKTNERKLNMIFHSKNCDQSQNKYDKESPKDLRYLYNFSGYTKDNTIIVDDHEHVLRANPKQTIAAYYFDVMKKNASKDDFLLDAISKLELIKSKYEKTGSVL
jgi:hypothetical protein